MAISREMYKRLLDNPANVSAEDMDLEDDQQPDGKIDDSAELPSVDPEADLVSPDIGDPDEINQENDLAQDKVAVVQPAPEQDSDIMAKLKRLKSGKPMDESSDEENQDVASDMKAPLEMRKEALKRIKQKYLGQ